MIFCPQAWGEKPQIHVVSKHDVNALKMNLIFFSTAGMTSLKSTQRHQRAWSRTGRQAGYLNNVFSHQASWRCCTAGGVVQQAGYYSPACKAIDSGHSGALLQIFWHTVDQTSRRFVVLHHVAPKINVNTTEGIDARNMPSNVWEKTHKWWSMLCVNAKVGGGGGYEHSSSAALESFQVWLKLLSVSVSLNS